MPTRQQGRGYLIGTLLSIVLTVIPFWLVMTGALGATVTTGRSSLLAIVQIVVHTVCFLHVDTPLGKRLDAARLHLHGIIVGITVIGTIWVMYHMNANMMPMPDGTMQSMKMG
jgi:cytochrome o ubiquinol oxidase operon protein cyoD